jgi:hypothetical protein
VEESSGTSTLIVGESGRSLPSECGAACGSLRCLDQYDEVALF